MKLNYQKPMLKLQGYAASQSIASCYIQIGLTDSMCIINDPDSTTIMKDLAWSGFFGDGCEMQAAGMEPDDSICYHTNANATFTS